jgi:hypothetical protein
LALPDAASAVGEAAVAFDQIGDCWNREVVVIGA